MRTLGVAVALAAIMVFAVTCGGDGASEKTAIRATEGPATTEAATPALAGAELGQSLANRFGCAACHTVTGEARVGPTWLGLLGKEETLDDGSTVTVDEAYLRESILDPNAKIVQGFVANIMPRDFRDKLTDDQVEALIAYIRMVE